MRRWIAALAFCAGCASPPDRVSGLRPLSPAAPDFAAEARGLVLRWEAFPTEDTDGAVARRVTDVTYDLLIYDDEERVDYVRNGLPAAEHAVEKTLEAGKTYAWSVRARFRIDGQERRTQWTEAPPYRGRSAEPPGRPLRGIPLTVLEPRAP
jgi:hypothetical protein